MANFYINFRMPKNPNASDYDIWSAVLDLIGTNSRTTPPPRPVVFLQQTPSVRNTSSFANSTEYRKLSIAKSQRNHLLNGCAHSNIYTCGCGGVPQRALPPNPPPIHCNRQPQHSGEPHADATKFFETYFGNITGLDSTAQAVLDKCKEGDNPLYNEERGWQDWPATAVEKEVLKWLSQVIRSLVQFAEAYDATQRINWRPLARPFQPLEGSITKCHWSQILVPGELKNDKKYDSSSSVWLDLGRYAREVLAAQDSQCFILGFALCGLSLRLWVFDRLGGIASESFDINKKGLQFVSVVLGFLLMNQEQLGFDPTIVTHRTKRYITIEKDGGVERLVIDEVIGRARCVTGRATTCWKDSWQYPERDEEGKLLYEAAAQGVTHVARYYHHETIRVDGKDDDVLGIRSGLVIPTGQKKASSKVTSSRSKSRQPCTDSSRVSGQKWSSDFVDTAFPPIPSKRALSNSPAKLPLPDEKLQNRVHRRVVVQDYGKPIFESSSRVALLVGLQGCIKGDISPRNLLVNEDKDNPSYRAFLIDLDLAIRVNRDGFSGACGKTGTRPFIAISMLFGERHSFMHDLESFFWVLFWICIHYESPGRAKTVEHFEKWN
ncbi:conserved hypothetical protein [Histoplasma capsulatum H143]|uniref:Fungal-type protein kinase domain-containing protein n=1 Tax=Ajellomyces capsulatus (strain H143) TaxID=544712 RepID=C6HMQ4_AJECH|nr:conserved hypothetical protein [Histoplasma capsulatum H143]